MNEIRQNSECPPSIEATAYLAEICGSATPDPNHFTLNYSDESIEYIDSLIGDCSASVNLLLQNIEQLDGISFYSERIIEKMTPEHRRHFIDRLRIIINNRGSSNEQRRSALSWLGASGPYLSQQDLQAIMNSTPAGNHLSSLRRAANNALLAIHERTDNADIQRSCWINIGEQRAGMQPDPEKSIFSFINDPGMTPL